MNILRNNRVRQWVISHTRNHSNANVPKRLVIEHLDQRQLVRIMGEDVISFLQGLTTCDMRLLQSPPTNSIYTMFLNKAGRVLYDAIMYRTPSDPSAVLIECDKDISNDLIRHLKLYRVRRKINIDSVLDEFKVWSVFDPFGDVNSNICNIQVPANVNGVEISHDPRLISLGHRIVTSSDKGSTDISKLYTDLSNVTVESPSSALNYRLYRYSLGVAEGVLDMPPGKQFPLEANCDLLNGVSFNKGCYIGQELTARVHHTGVIRKRHMPVLLTAPLSANSTRAIHKEDEAKVGNILGSIGDRALGLLRIEHVLKSKELMIDGKPCYVEKPKWWPLSLFNKMPIGEGV